MKRFAIVGLMVVACAAASTGGEAAIASAAPTENNTGFTCVETEAGKGEFENAHCNPNGPKEGKNWKHAAISPNLGTQLTLSDGDGKGGSLGESEFIFPVAGVNVIFRAQHVECLSCMIENHSEGEGSIMDMTGVEGGRLRYTNVTTSFTPPCTVKNKEFVTEPLKFTTISPSQIEISPITGTTIGAIHLEGGPSCGTVFMLFGLFRGTLEGSTVNFKTGAGELREGAKSEAFLIAKATLSAGLTIEPEHHFPLALTK